MLSDLAANSVGCALGIPKSVTKAYGVPGEPGSNQRVSEYIKPAKLFHAGFYTPHFELHYQMI